jgi:hypothetical protein
VVRRIDRNVFDGNRNIDETLRHVLSCCSVGW